MPKRLLLVLLLAPMATPLAIAAQDVEMLGRRYGTRPPDSYFEELRRDPGAFRFTRGRAARGPVSPIRRPEGLALSLGPREGPLLGDYYLPVILGLFSDSDPTPPIDQATLDATYFGGGPGSVNDYYDEVSGGRFNLIGETNDWIRSTYTQDSVTDGDSGLANSRIGEYIHDLLALTSGVDWGRYDNDGPDGIPNSSDDDGFVDALAVIHPTRGAECGGSGQADRIWAHKWSLLNAAGSVFTTTVPANGGSGGFIRIDDYFVQGVLACGSPERLNEIGVFTHETGHAFGLPDLYDTCTNDPFVCPGDLSSHQGVGTWDLMSAGSWGCNNSSPYSPCHMGAWTKAQLGWVTVVPLAADTDHGVVTLPPVASDTVFRVDANDGSGEYFLLENRQATGYDLNLYREGLLIWQIDPDWIESRWTPNVVNAYQHRGVWLRQADGFDELGQPGGGRGDAADPFPGQTVNRSFHGASTPAAHSYQGGPTAVTLDQIEEVGDDIRMRLSTRYTRVTLRADGTPSPAGVFTVDGAAPSESDSTFRAVPFLSHSIEAVAAASATPGERQRFVEWADSTVLPRDRSVVVPLDDVAFEARYGGTEYELAIATTGGVGAVEPGSFPTSPASPDRWFDAGTDVSVEAIPVAGFSFLGWSGDLAGQSNPAAVTMSAPVSAGADFELLYSVQGASLAMTATESQEVQLTTENGTAPFSWRIASGTLPHGLTLSGTGRLSGAPLDLGDFDIEVEATDAIGLPATATVSITVDEPVLSLEALASPFLLSGPALTPAELSFLNRQGNGVSGYDIGDFRAWVLAHPSLPLSANLSPRGAESRTLLLRMDPVGGER